MGKQATSLYAEIVVIDGHNQISTAQHQGKSDLSGSITINADDYPEGTVISIRRPAPIANALGGK